MERAAADGRPRCIGPSTLYRIPENISIFDFELTGDEMSQKTAPDRNDRFAAY